MISDDRDWSGRQAPTLDEFAVLAEAANMIAASAYLRFIFVSLFGELSVSE